MKKKEVAAFLSDTNLSPEDLGRRLDISGMTIRRWMQGEPNEKIAPIYEAAIRDTVLRMIVEGKLDASSPTVSKILQAYEPLAQDAAIRLLGINAAKLAADSTGGFTDQVVSGLMKIGDDEARRENVKSQLSSLAKFKKQGDDWADRIKTLRDVLTSKDLLSSDKLVAFGAFFYLFCVFDLIPDVIPVFGLIDDFAILGIAAAYYAKRSGPANRVRENV